LELLWLTLLYGMNQRWLIMWKMVRLRLRLIY
jgi:hypothetical protein